MSLFGPLAGLLALVFIGLGFLWVVRAEYELGWQWWYLLLGAGAALVLASAFFSSALLSCILGIAGASLAWGAFELEAQAGRARQGLYPVKTGSKPKPPLWRLLSRIHPPRL